MAPWEAGQALKYLLDTNIISEVRKPKPHGGVLAWFMEFHLSGFAIPAIALFELQMGVEQIRFQDANKAAMFEYWAARVAAGTNVLAFDAAAGREAARLLAGKPSHLLLDGMIAAIAKVNGLTIATRNTRDFDGFEVPLTNPFLYKK